MKVIAHSLHLLLFLVYAHSTLVMWSLYLIERHDIIAYYENMDDRSNGVHHMERITESSNSKDAGVPAHVCMDSQEIQYCLSAQQYVSVQAIDVPFAYPDNDAVPSEPGLDDIFRPPCAYSTDTSSSCG